MVRPLVVEVSIGCPLALRSWFLVADGKCRPCSSFWDLSSARLEYPAYSGIARLCGSMTSIGQPLPGLPQNIVWLSL